MSDFTLHPLLYDRCRVILNRTVLAVASDSVYALGQSLTGVANVFTLIKLLDSTN